MARLSADELVLQFGHGNNAVEHLNPINRALQVNARNDASIPATAITPWNTGHNTPWLL